jgi:hypothetical protein
MDYTVQSSRILRDAQNNSRGVGFARYELVARLHCQDINFLVALSPVTSVRRLSRSSTDNLLVRKDFFSRFDMPILLPRRI